MRIRPYVDPTYWRLHWGPVWLRKLFCGRWTQAEVDEVNQRGRERRNEIKGHLEPHACSDCDICGCECPEACAWPCPCYGDSEAS